MRHRILVTLLAITCSAACIPSDTAAKGGVLVTLKPSEAMRTGRFKTSDGWDVVIERAFVGLGADLRGCGYDFYVGGSGADEDSWGPSGVYIDARVGGFLEVRAARSNRNCELSLEPQANYIGDLRTGALRLRGIGTKGGQRLAFDLEIEGSGYEGDRPPSKSVFIPPADKTDITAELAIEAVFRPDETSTVGFDDLVEADGDFDGRLTLDEWQTYGRGTGAVDPSNVFAKRLRQNAIRFFP